MAILRGVTAVSAAICTVTGMSRSRGGGVRRGRRLTWRCRVSWRERSAVQRDVPRGIEDVQVGGRAAAGDHDAGGRADRKSTRLNSSHSQISYAVFCLKKKKKKKIFDSAITKKKYEHKLNI